MQFLTILKIFSDPLSLSLYAISVFGAQVGIVMLLVGKNKTKKSKQIGTIIFVVSILIFTVAYLLNMI
ncbi:MAG: hypothetical protein HKN22_03995 [Bacteroidia bacterium]|nr:hypothetical protein [Bacteroidia bacterium]